MDDIGQIIFRGIEMIGNALTVLIIARAAFSWISAGKTAGLAVFVNKITEPILSPLRKLIQRSPFGGANTMIDFSPVLALVLIQEFVNFSAVLTVIFGSGVNGGV